MRDDRGDLADYGYRVGETRRAVHCWPLGLVAGHAAVKARGIVTVNRAPYTDR